MAPKKKVKNQSYVKKDIELKFGIHTEFWPPGSKTNINLQFDVSMTVFTFRPFH